MSDPEFDDKGRPLCQSGAVSRWSGEFCPCPNRARYRSYENVYLCGRHLRHAGRASPIVLSNKEIL